MSRNDTGISNRTTPQEEAQERREHPPTRLPEEQVGGSIDINADHASPDGPSQTSHKSGSHSLSEKERSTRHAAHSAPSTHGTAGASGRESDDGEDPMDDARAAADAPVAGS